MTHEFDHVRDAFAASIAGRLLGASEDALARAWRASATRRQLQLLNSALGIRSAAIAIAVAMLLQPALISIMPRAAAPSIPWWAYVGASLLSLLVAWQAEAAAAGWASSRLRRLLH